VVKNQLIKKPTMQLSLIITQRNIMKKLTILIYGTLSYIMFLGVFVYAIGFIGNIAVKNSLDAMPNKPFMQALMINLGLLAAFSLQHSGMARKGFKSWITKYIPQSAERSTYVLISNLAMIALFVFWQPMGGTIWSVDSELAKSAIMTIYMFGWIIVLISTFLTSHFELFGLKQIWFQLSDKIMPKAKFVSPSLYKLVRHPMYVGWIIVFWSATNMTIAHLVFALMCTAYIVIAIVFEEKDLVDELGEEYREYQKQVPKLVPKLKYSKPSKKVTTLMLILMLLPSIGFSFETLGEDEQCDFSSDDYSIQDLIDIGATDIRLTNQVIFFENLVVTGIIQLRGGYDNCADAESDTVSETNTFINGNAAGTVIDFSPGTSDIGDLQLFNINLINGLSTSSTKGGAITVKSPTLRTTRLSTFNVVISHNVSNNGGGVYISGSNTNWYAYNTNIMNNTANGNGGGVYCNNSNITFYDGSGISFNTAQSTVNSLGKGGGIYAVNDCDLDISTGANEALVESIGVFENSATSHGGGLYASTGSIIKISDHLDLIHIRNNTANSNNNGFGDGGGIYLTGNTTRLDATGVKINNNKAANGAGIAVIDYSIFKLGLDINNNCWNMSHCNEISENTTNSPYSMGGAIFSSDVSLVSLRHAYVFSNRADIGTIIFAENGSQAILNYVTAYRNGDRSINDWDDRNSFYLNDAGVNLFNVTLANNHTFNAVFELHGNSVVTANNSIIHEPITNNTVNTSGAGTSVDEFNCVLLDNSYGVTGLNDSLITSDPGFVNASNNNYHLKAGSHAIDFCSELVNVQQIYDIDGDSTSHDDPSVTNQLGTFDAGSDEFNSDVIFINGFD